MVYQPSKKEVEQINNLNKGYVLIRNGIKLIKENLPKKDSEVEMLSYKMGKSFDKIIKRIYKILEKQYIDREFIEIIDKRKTKEKPNRIKKKDKEAKKTKKKKRTVKKRK